MPLPTEPRAGARWRARLLGALCLLSSSIMAMAPGASVSGPSQPVAAAAVSSASASGAVASGLTREQVTAVLDALRADPDLPHPSHDKTLRFKKSDEPSQPPEAQPGLPAWLKGLLRWLSSGARWLMWLLGALAVALLVVYIRRWAQEHAQAEAGKSALLPSHVRDLDIRPESLPDRIGASALALWERGEARAALSLLYRGALSRLVHDHAVPIRAASTEGECLQLAAPRINNRRNDYFGRLVSAWLLAVYGGRLPDGASMQALCVGFDADFDADFDAGVADGALSQPVAVAS